jgi:hypothetical protein
MFPGVSVKDARITTDAAPVAPKRGRPAKNRSVADAAVQ